MLFKSLRLSFKTWYLLSFKVAGVHYTPTEKVCTPLYRISFAVIVMTIRNFRAKKEAKILVMEFFLKYL